MRFKVLVLAIVASVSVSGCAFLGTVLHVPPSASTLDKTLVVLSDMQWAVSYATSVQWLNASEGVVATDAITEATSAVSQAKAGQKVQAIAANVLTDALGHLPSTSRIVPYLAGLIATLKAL